MAADVELLRELIDAALSEFSDSLLAMVDSPSAPAPEQPDEAA